MSLHLRIKHEQHIPIGVFYAILSAIFFTLMSLTLKFIGERASTDAILFVRFFVSLLLILPWAIKYPKATLQVNRPLQLVFRSISSLLSLACFFYALKYISLTNGLLLKNTSPIFIPLILWIFHQIKTPHKIWIGIFIGFIGIGFVLKPGVQFFQPAALIGLASGIFTASSYVVIRFLTKSIPVIQILFYNFLISSIITGLFLPFNWISFDFKVGFLLILVGIFGSICQLFTTLSLAKAPVRITSPFAFLSIVFGAFAEFFIWNRIPDLYDFIGISCVILGGIFVIYYGQKELNIS
jgi:drug/metabolite transporter (DMT)-like permease